MPLKQLNKKSLPQSEWFYPFHVESLSSSGKTLHMKAEDKFLKPIAERLQVLKVKSLEVECKLSTQNGGHILNIQGRFKAEIVQECVVTLKPIESIIEDDFEAWYADHEKAVSFNRAKHQIESLECGDEIQILEEKEDPEALIDGQVDLGEVAIQFLSLTINPYPRAEGAGDEGALTIEQAKSVKSLSSVERPNPFAALKNWRPKD